MKNRRFETSVNATFSPSERVRARGGSFRLFFSVLILIALPACFLSTEVNAQDQKQEPAQAQKQPAKAEPPRLLAVEFYADWCAACKVLMPKITEAKTGLQGKPLLFVRFDMTNDFTKEQALYMAEFAGLQDVYRKGGGKTGMVALVDVKSKSVLAVIGQKKTLEEINAMFSDAISKANAN